MPGYKLLSIYHYSGQGPYIDVLCTDPDILKWIEREVKSQDSPKCKTSYPTPYYLRLEKLDNAGITLWWIMQFLGLAGWEPFEADHEVYFSFRKAIEAAPGTA